MNNYAALYTISAAFTIIYPIASFPAITLLKAEQFAGLSGTALVPVRAWSRKSIAIPKKSMAYNSVAVEGPLTL